MSAYVMYATCLGDRTRSRVQAKEELADATGIYDYTPDAGGRLTSAAIEVLLEDAGPGRGCLPLKVLLADDRCYGTIND